jgi:hypothetical protein
MGAEERRCGGIEEYQWLITLILEALIRMIVAYLDRDKLSGRPEKPAAEDQNDEPKEASDG